MRLINGSHKLFLSTGESRTICIRTANDYSFEWSDNNQAIVIYDDCITEYDAKTSDAQFIAWLK